MNTQDVYRSLANAADDDAQSSVALSEGERVAHRVECVRGGHSTRGSIQLNLNRLFNRMFGITLL